MQNIEHNATQVQHFLQDGTQMPKHVRMIIIINFVLLFAFYFILSSSIFGQYMKP